jgi:hypothetical protein
VHIVGFSNVHFLVFDVLITKINGLESFNFIHNIVYENLTKSGHVYPG